MKKIISRILVAAGVFLIFSCSEQVIDLQPVNTETSATYYELDENCFKALVSCYRSMNLDQLYLIHGDLPSDDTVKGGSGLSDGINFQEMAEFTASASNALISSHWANLYQLITRTKRS